VIAHAQSFEVGGTVGGGAIAAEDISSTSAVAAGAEACGFCSGSFALFAEYSHLEVIGATRGYDITRFDLFGIGLRIQGGRRVRPFFDVGFAIGRDEYGLDSAHSNPGAVLAGGVGIPLGNRFYLRPQFRVYALRGLHVAAAGTVGVGARF
jgi:hypothetical protein